MPDCYENWLWFVFGAAFMWLASGLVVLILWGVELGKSKLS